MPQLKHLWTACKALRINSWLHVHIRQDPHASTNFLILQTNGSAAPSVETSQRRYASYVLYGAVPVCGSLILHLQGRAAN